MEFNEEHKKQIDNVIINVSGEVDLTNIGSPSEIVDYIEEKYECESDISTNGWDVDFFISFKIGDFKFMLCGSWYYGKSKFCVEY